MSTATAPNLGALHQQRRALEAQLATGAVSDDELIRLESAAARPGLLLELRKLDVTIARVEREQAAAREAERERLRADFHRRKRELLGPLVATLRQARDQMCALQDLENQEHHSVGTLGNRFSWPSLGRNDQGESFLDHWVDGLRADGLYDADPAPPQKPRGA